MPWAKLDDRFPRHPKVLRAGSASAWLYVSGLCYANEHLTDGIIPRAAVRSLTDLPHPEKLAEKLVEVRLWERHGDDYFIHDFHDENDSAEVVLAKREALSAKRAVAGCAGGRRSGESRRSKPEANPKQVASETGSKPEATVEAKTKPDADADADRSPPISPLQGDTPPTLPGMAPDPPNGKPRKREIPTHIRPGAARVLDLLNTARRRVIPGARDLRPTDENLRHIAARLWKGATEDECAHVVAVREAEVRGGDNPVYFDAVTPFRPDCFAKSLAAPINGTRRADGIDPEQRAANELAARGPAY